MHILKHVPSSSFLSGIFTAAIVLLSLPCAAHHSTAMFDVKGLLKLEGTVKLFQWTNPHCWIQVLVPTGGTVAEWSVEMGAPSQLYRNGWRPGTLKAGDRVRLVIHPMRNGTQGGQFVSGTGPTGLPFRSGAPEPQT